MHLTCDISHKLVISTLWPVPLSGIQTSPKLRCSSIPCACTPRLPSRVSERACFPSLSIQQPKDESQVARTRICERRFGIFELCNKMYQKEECYSTSDPCTRHSCTKLYVDMQRAQTRHQERTWSLTIQSLMSCSVNYKMCNFYRNILKSHFHHHATAILFTL
jgi:hypothetical protein